MKDEIKKQIEQSSENFGLTNKEKTIFEISSNDKNGDKRLVLKSGSWQGDEPWFGIDENGGLLRRYYRLSAGTQRPEELR